MSKWEPDDGNPYAPPRRANGMADKRWLRRLLWRSLGFVVVTSLIGGIGGLLVGGGLAVLVPGYYRSIFAGGSEPHFDPLAVGIGLGLTQGLAVGMLAGLGLVAVWYWFQARR